MRMGTDRAPRGTWTEMGRLLLAAALLVAVAACATSGGGGATRAAAQAAAVPPPPPPPTYKNDGKPNPDDPYRFVIKFERGCPVSATPDLLNCPNAQAACVRVKGGQTVRFDSDPAGTEFMISFDPFGKTRLPSSGGFVTAEAAMHGNGKGKPHTFVVTAASGCDTPLDPQILLD